MLFIKNKHATLRLCIDYRILNIITIKSRYQFSTIHDLFDQLKKAIIFFKIDLRSRYHQLSIKSSDTHKILFQTRYGYYEFVVLSFLLTNAPTNFINLMTSVYEIISISLC